MASPRWRRLTRRQYENTVIDLMYEILGPDAGSFIRDQLNFQLEALPQDVRLRSSEDLKGSYRRLDQAVSQTHAEVWYRIATWLGGELTLGVRVSQIFGSCAEDSDPSNDQACLDDTIRRVGSRVLRRPLDDDEVAQYRSFYGGPPGEDVAGMADVLAALFSAPQFLYMVEHGDPDADADAEVVELTDFELASRLSYHFWDTLPDEELWQAAESGALTGDPEEYERQVDRLFNDERTRETVREFYRDWLKLEDLPEMDTRLSFPVFYQFAGDDLPGQELREHMIEDALDLLDYHTWQDPGSVPEVLLSEYAFPRHADLAAIYDVEVWDGESTPARFPEGLRPGLLTRAAFLATGSASTRPIMKGVFIRKNMLCDPIPPPPPDVAADPPELSDTQSTREVVEALTEQEGTVCASCHSTLINALGFATENFDALARVRTEQPLYDEGGQVIGSAAVDTTSTPRVTPTDETASEGAADLMDLIVDSGKVEDCLARHYFRYSFGRFEESGDACFLDSLAGALREGGTLQDMLRRIALSEPFRQRYYGSE